MLHKVPTLVLVAILSLVFAAGSFARDDKKMADKKTEKHALMSVSCDADCGFMCRSHDEKELTSIVKTHAKKAHHMDLTDKQVKDMMKTEEAK